MSIKIADFFAGIGGFSKAFHSVPNAETAVANEFDKNACKSFSANYPDVLLLQQDIRTIKETILPDFDIFCGGFPCQPYSLAGRQQGLSDARGQLFFEIVRIIKHKKPKCIFLENVANLVSVNNGRDFAVIVKSLEDLGYYLRYEILGSHTHANIPQCRNRLLIVGFLNNVHFEFPKEISLTSSLNNFIDRSQKKLHKYYYSENSQYFESLNKTIINESVYQIRRVYIRENKNNLCPTLTANMGGGGHNVPIIRDDFGIRKLTPTECLSLQGITDFKQIVADTHLYKQAGNSVCVPLIKKVAEKIMDVFKE